MAKQICGGLGSNPDEHITNTVLARHLGVSRNTVPAIAAKFALTKWDNGFRKYDVFRQVHGLEPLLMDTALDSFKIAHRQPKINLFVWTSPSFNSPNAARFGTLRSAERAAMATNTSFGCVFNQCCNVSAKVGWSSTISILCICIQNSL